MLWSIIRALEDPLRRILEVVSVADAPMPQEVVARAADVEGGAFAKAVSRLRLSHMVQTRGTRGTDRIEPYHDCVRVAVLANLGPARRAEVHRNLALALAAARPVDPDALVTHWRGAGDLEQTARFAVLAGDRAAEALAFDRAATFYELALTHDASPSSERRPLLVKLGDARANAGRSHAAAKAFGKAAEGANAAEALDLRRREAEQLMMAGEIDAGAVALHHVLAAVGLRAPRSPLGALFWLLVYRLWASLRGLRFEERAREEVSREARARVDALFAVAHGFAMVDPILSACMIARHTMTALRVGDGFQVMRAASFEATNRAGDGGPVGRRERRLTDIARRLADKAENPDGWGLFQACNGISIYLRGEWKLAGQALDTAHSNVRTGRSGWQSNVDVFGAWTLMYLGEFRELARRCRRLVTDADALGDIYTSVQLRDGSLSTLWLARTSRTRPDVEIQEAMAQWSHTRFLLQHWHAMVGEAEIELYLDHGRLAYDRLIRDQRALRKSMLLNCQHVRVRTDFTRARCAVAAAGALPEMRSRLLAEARALGRALERERMRYAEAFASMVSACVSNAEGDSPAAAASLRAGIERAEGVHMSMFAAASRYQLGSLLGGEEGSQLVSQAKDAMVAQDVRAPARFAALWLPGHWNAD